MRLGDAGDKARSDLMLLVKPRQVTRICSALQAFRIKLWHIKARWPFNKESRLSVCAWLHAWTYAPTPHSLRLVVGGNHEGSLTTVRITATG